MDYPVLFWLQSHTSYSKTYSVEWLTLPDNLDPAVFVDMEEELTGPYLEFVEDSLYDWVRNEVVATMATESVDVGYERIPCGSAPHMLAFALRIIQLRKKIIAEEQQLFKLLDATRDIGWFVAAADQGSRGYKDARFLTQLSPPIPAEIFPFLVPNPNLSDIPSGHYGLGYGENRCIASCFPNEEAEDVIYHPLLDEMVKFEREHLDCRPLIAIKATDEGYHFKVIGAFDKDQRNADDTLAEVHTYGSADDIIFTIAFHLAGREGEAPDGGWKLTWEIDVDSLLIKPKTVTY